MKYKNLCKNELCEAIYKKQLEATNCKGVQSGVMWKENDYSPKDGNNRFPCDT